MPELIEIKSPGVQYGYKGPEVYECLELETTLYKPRVTFMLPKQEPGAVVVVAEEANWRNHDRKLFILYLEQFTDAFSLLERVLEINRFYRVGDTYCRLSPVERDILYSFNAKQEFRFQISTMSPPRVKDSGSLVFHVNLLKELLRPGRERVFSPQDSDIPRLLQAIPDMPSDVTDDRYPAFAALAYAVAALYFHPTIEPEERYEKKFNIDDWDPFAPADHRDRPNINNYDPWKFLNKEIRNG